MRHDFFIQKVKVNKRIYWVKTKEWSKFDENYWPMDEQLRPVYTLAIKLASLKVVDRLGCMYTHCMLGKSVSLVMWCGIHTCAIKRLGKGKSRSAWKDRPRILELPANFSTRLIYLTFWRLGVCPSCYTLLYHYSSCQLYRA